MTTTKKSFLVVGGGELGIDNATLLRHAGHEVHLITNDSDIFAKKAASAISLLVHSGPEYSHPTHIATGIGCQEAMFANYLTHPMEFLTTSVCSPNHPVIYALSNQSAQDDAPFDSHVRPERFISGGEELIGNFRKNIFEPLAQLIQARDRIAKNQALKKSEAMLGGFRPDNIFYQTSLPSSSVARGLHTAAYSAGAGYNNPHSYAYYKALLRNFGVQPHFNTTIESTVRRGDGKYDVLLTNNIRLVVDSIQLAAGTGNPHLALKIPGAQPAPKGTFYGNGMLYVRLAHDIDPMLIFILQQRYGMALSCIDPVARICGVYVPNPDDGSQIYQETFTGTDGKLPKNDHEGKEIAQEIMQKILNRAASSYPALQGATILGSRIGTVFNPDSQDSPLGTDRRVRIGVIKEIAPGVILGHPAKRTSCWLTALGMNHAAFLSLGLPGLPVNEQRGLGPYKIDVLKMVVDGKLNFKHVPDIKIDDAKNFVEMHKPLYEETSIKLSHPLFHSKSLGRAKAG